MPTRQAVWPVDLIERRRLAVDLEARMRALMSSGAASGDRDARLRALRAEHAGLPCPHWDVHLVDATSGEWSCDACQATITPTWVQLADQESSLRRAAHLRTARRWHLDGADVAAG